MAKEVEPLYKYVGSKIQELRGEHMTQRMLGQLLEPAATRASIANIENGKQRVLVHTLLQLSNIFQVSVEEFLPVKKATSASHINKAVQKELRQKLNLPARQLKNIENIIRTAENAA